MFAREDVAKQLLFRKPIRAAGKIGRDPEVHVRNIREIKITVRDAEVLRPLAQNCSNNEIAQQLKIARAP